MSILPSFDETRFRLGTLCNKSHDWKNTGQSLRSLRRRDCVQCATEREKSRERSRRYWTDEERSKELQGTYGITLSDYEHMLEQQGNACAICGKVPAVIRLAVDHCHDTKTVRGLLCSNCNMGIGHFKDNVGLLQAAATYLRRSA